MGEFGYVKVHRLLELWSILRLDVEIRNGSLGRVQAGTARILAFLAFFNFFLYSIDRGVGAPMRGSTLI